MATIIGITGGIGSGKSVVSAICRTKGYKVYDCDSMAKYLMTNSPQLKDQIINLFSHTAYQQNGQLNSKFISQIIFNDIKKRLQLNNIVHTEVFNDIRHWIDNNNCDDILFIESAILYSSGIDQVTHYNWIVDADVDIRIARVICRNNMGKEEVIARIKSQEDEFKSIDKSKTYHINNNNNQSIILQINQLIENLIIKN